MGKLDSFVNDTLAALNEKINREIEEYLLENMDKFDDPVLCITQAEFAVEEKATVMSASIMMKLKLMERRDIPPLVEICDG